MRRSGRANPTSMPPRDWPAQTAHERPRPLWHLPECQTVQSVTARACACVRACVCVCVCVCEKAREVDKASHMGSVVPERVHILGKHELNVLYYCLMNVTVNSLILISVNSTLILLTLFNWGVICLSTQRMRMQNAVWFDRLPWLSPCGSFAVAVLSAYCYIKL